MRHAKRKPGTSTENPSCGLTVFINLICGRSDGSKDFLALSANRLRRNALNAKSGNLARQCFHPLTPLLGCWPNWKVRQTFQGPTSSKEQSHESVVEVKERLQKPASARQADNAHKTSSPQKDLLHQMRMLVSIVFGHHLFWSNLFSREVC